MIFSTISRFSEISLYRQHRMMGMVGVVILLSFGSAGCVKKSTFEALQAQRVDELKVTEDLKIKLVTTEAQRDQVTRERDSLQGQLKKAETKNTQLLSDQSQLQASINDMQNALRAQARRQAEVEARTASFKALLDRFRPLIDTGKLKVQIVEGRMVLVLATDILFDRGSAELSEAGRGAISDVATALASFPNRSFQVEGHTDNDPISTRRYPSNWDLAADRALNVVKAMVESA